MFDPAKGSIHNRGAVDITLVDANNRELDMGTPFDFGKRPAMVMTIR
jgi:D-alanyl-D-alanine dipeptidase